MMIHKLKATLYSVPFLVGLATVTPAQACDSAFYDHNGSRMEVHVCDGRMVIEYDAPKRSLRKHGVRPGTVLFRGSVFQMSGGGSKITGSARVFKSGCGPKAYEVNGWMQDNSITMAGRAPVRNSQCGIRKYRNDNLRFNGL